jgi:predicted nucleic acid-binding protein
VTGFVVDASVAVKWYVAESDSQHAHALLASPFEFAAPNLLRLELASALWKNWRRNLIDLDQAKDALNSIEKSIKTWCEPEALLTDAVEMAFDLGHHVYDCLYLVLASRLRFTVVTADERTIRVAPRNLVIALADWAP